MYHEYMYESRLLVLHVELTIHNKILQCIVDDECEKGHRLN